MKQKCNAKLQHEVMSGFILHETSGWFYRGMMASTNFTWAKCKTVVGGLLIFDIWQVIMYNYLENEISAESRQKS